MNERPMIYVPAQILRQKAKKVTDFGPELRELAESMTYTMRKERGMGLAASQVGEPIRLVVIEYEPEEKGETRIPLTILVNPSITDYGRQTDWMDEGCLSIPGVEVPVRRPTQVNVLAEDLSGKRIKIRAKDLFARILQHEIDHTNGILMTDRAYPDLKELEGLRVVFMGTPEHVTPYLTALASTQMNVVGVITETDKPAGRNRVLTSPPVKQHAQMLNIPVYQFETLKDESAFKTFADLKADLVVVVAYGKIIPEKWLNTPTHGFLNIHYSLLPELRGASPHQTAILEGKKTTGFTIFRLDKGMDTGDILIQKAVAITPHDNSYSLMSQLVLKSIPALLEALPAYISGKKRLIPQDNSKATYTRLFTKEDGRIDWTKPAEEIDRQIRAFSPWPAAFTEIADLRLIIHAAHMEKGRLTIDIIQPAGKKPMKFRDYLRGNQNGLTFFSDIDTINRD